MKITGIVVEYNPMHNGHIYHLEESRQVSKADFIVAVMSGSFVQRGEPAIMNKWTRAKVAVENGVDLVVELPFAFACNRAEYFAKGATDILKGLGCDSLVFGAETADIDKLKKIARITKDEPEKYKVALKSYLDDGESYPSAVSKAVSKLLGEEAGNILSKPNNLLAIEYIKHGENMEALCIERKGNYHIARGDNTGDKEIESEDNFVSAEEIRNTVYQNHGKNKRITERSNDERPACKGKMRAFMPDNTHEAFQETFLRNALPNEDIYFDMLRAKIISMSSNEMKISFGITEGLENRIIKEVRNAESLNDLIKRVKTKRYIYNGIYRAFTHILMDFNENEDSLNNWAPYARVLAAGKKGKELIRTLKKEEINTIPIITNINKETDIDEEGNSKNFPLLKYDIVSSDIRNIICEQKPYDNSDFVCIPEIF